MGKKIAMIEKIKEQINVQLTPNKVLNNKRNVLYAECEQGKQAILESYCKKNNIRCEFRRFYSQITDVWIWL